MIFAQVQDAYGGLLGQNAESLPHTGGSLELFMLMGVIFIVVGMAIWMASRMGRFTN